jgi:hypothetical protein
LFTGLNSFWDIVSRIACRTWNAAGATGLAWICAAPVHNAAGIFEKEITVFHVWIVGTSPIDVIVNPLFVRGESYDVEESFFVGFHFRDPKKYTGNPFQFRWAIAKGLWILAKVDVRIQAILSTSTNIFIQLSEIASSCCLDHTSSPPAAPFYVCPGQVVKACWLSVAIRIR